MSDLVVSPRTLYRNVKVPDFFESLTLRVISFRILHPPSAELHVISDFVRIVANGLTGLPEQEYVFEDLSRLTFVNPRKCALLLPNDDVSKRPSNALQS